MSNEIEDIEKRLKAIEDSIKELGKMDLFIVKAIVGCVAPMEINIATRTMKGEEAKQFGELFSKKSEALDKELKEAKMPADAFRLLIKLDDEISDYIKATKIDTADKAMEVAHSFIKKYSPVALPLKAKREDDVWLVDIDVGALAVKIAKIKVDAKTGDILSYEIPQKESKES